VDASFHASSLNIYHIVNISPFISVLSIKGYTSSSHIEKTLYLQHSQPTIIETTKPYYNTATMSNSPASNKSTPTPQKDKLLALATLISTLSLATLDLKASSHMLNDPPSKLASSLPHHTPISLPKSPVLVEGVAHSYTRAATSSAFFYLAWQDYQRMQQRQEGGIQEWRWKVWAGCGAVGVLVQSLRPLPGGVSGVLGSLGAGEGVKGQARRMGILAMVKGVGLMCTVPFCFGAWRSM
jgi:hypothetical protein